MAGEYSRGTTMEEIKLWDPATGRQIVTLRGHRGAVTHFIIASDRRGGLQTMVTVIDRAMAQLWDLKNRNLISHILSRGDTESRLRPRRRMVLDARVDGKKL